MMVGPRDGRNESNGDDDYHFSSFAVLSLSLAFLAHFHSSRLWKLLNNALYSATTAKTFLSTQQVR